MCCHLFLKRCFFAKKFQKRWYLAILALKLKYLKLGISKNFWSIKSTFHNFFFPVISLSGLYSDLLPFNNVLMRLFQVIGIDCKLLCCLSTKSLKRLGKRNKIWREHPHMLTFTLQGIHYTFLHGLCASCKFQWRSHHGTLTKFFKIFHSNMLIWNRNPNFLLHK